MRKKKEKSLYDQIRKSMPPPSKVIVPKKGRGTYNRKKEKDIRDMHEIFTSLSRNRGAF